MNNIQAAIHLLHHLEKVKAQRDELLQALEESLGFLEFAYRDIQMNDYSFNLLEETTDKVRAAIAKAKGE